jgi:signal transduction histidine kinase/ligand-binding sensor domain-containing protein/DNA-binding response OmpR family regulator
VSLFKHDSSFRVHRLWFVMAAVASLDVAVARAQTPVALPRPWVHESWTTKDGLPVNSINANLQDRTGYIWAATFDGLVRFDGVRFTVFNTANSEELPSNRIVQVKEGRDGTLWLATEESHIIRFRDGRFTNLTFENGKPGGGVPILVTDSLGAVWVGTPEGLWALRNDRLVRVGRGVIDAPVTAVLQRPDKSLLVAVRGRGIFRVTGDEQVAKMTMDPAIDSTFVIRLADDGSGSVWICATTGLWEMRDHIVKVRSRISLTNVSNVVRTPTTGLRFVETGSGVYRIDSDSATLVRPAPSAIGHRLWLEGDAVWTVNGQDVFRGDRRVLTLPPNRTLSSAFFDREGSLWLGTDASGLHRLKQALFTTYTVADGLSFENVYSTYVDRAGMIWVGTWGKGASLLEPSSGRARPIGDGGHPTSVNSFYEDSAGAIWMATAANEGGIRRCARPALKCERAAPRALGDRPVFALYGDADGTLWAGAPGQLLHYDGKTWTTLPTTSGGREATVRAFARTRDGALWMGTNGAGLLRLSGGAFSQITRADGLPSDLIRSVYEDGDGWLWVGTEGRGLARLDPRAWADSARGRPDARRIVRIGTKDGLFDEVIHQILEDDQGRLWMNTNRGVFWVARAELNEFANGKISRLHSTAYTERDGLRNREGNGGVQPAGAKSRDGRLWFPTQDGVVVVNPADIRRERLAPPVVVERVVAGGGSLWPRSDSIELHPSERTLQIEYTALTFLEPTNVRFRYRLEPYDTAWVDVGNRRTAFYTKVPPGRYTFMIEASDAAGGWYEPGARLAVRLLPRVTETGPFRWALVAAGAALLFAAIRLRDARLRSRALHLEHVVAERTAALRDREHELADRNARLHSLDEAKTRFFSNVSHELRTPLTLTIGPLEDLRARSDGDPQVERWLDIALRNSRRLLRLVNQLLDVAKLEAGAMHLAPRSVDVAQFTRGIVGAFAAVAERKGIHLTATTPDMLRGSFDADALEKILTNLVSNAIKFTPNGGSVDVNLSAVDGAARLVVRDSGPGIPAEQIAHVFERFYQVDESPSRSQPGTGIGLSLVKELVELHGGTVSVESDAAGTVFTATIPPVESGEGVGVDGMAHVPSLSVSVTSEEAIVARNDEPASRENLPTLLVVDDSADLRAYVRDHFAPGFRVIEAADGIAGIELARAQLPDVVLSDVMMPRADGFDLIRALRGSPETDFLSIVLLTAQAEDDKKLEGLAHGADDYIVKPFDMRELELRVRNLIRSRQRLRDRFANLPEGPPPLPVALSPADQAYVARIRDAIQKRLSDPAFGVSELADAMSQDRSRVFRRIKELFDQSPSEFIRRMRIEAAERVLTQSSATVSEVAYAVGFNSVSYFCRAFQEVYGATPAAYRNRAPVASD